MVDPFEETDSLERLRHAYATELARLPPDDGEQIGALRRAFLARRDSLGGQAAMPTAPARGPQPRPRVRTNRPEPPRERRWGWILRVAMALLVIRAIVRLLQ